MMYQTYNVSCSTYPVKISVHFLMLYPKVNSIFYIFCINYTLKRIYRVSQLNLLQTIKKGLQ
jgi:hypothetical protein